MKQVDLHTMFLTEYVYFIAYNHVLITKEWTSEAYIMSAIRKYVAERNGAAQLAQIFITKIPS